jgi:Uma2 family endonuclease
MFNSSIAEISKSEGFFNMSLAKVKFTIEEYIALDKVSEERLEYWDGNIFSMSGASPEHVQIQVNLTGFLYNQFQNRPCRAFSSDMRIKVPAYPPYRYPDLSALCDDPVFERVHGLEILTNPSLIIEILSPTTEAFDQGDKFEYYKSIPTFSEYLIVAQDRPFVTRHWRVDSVWHLERFSSLSKEISLSSIGVTLAMQAIYRGINL